MVKSILLPVLIFVSIVILVSCLGCMSGTHRVYSGEIHSLKGRIEKIKYITTGELFVATHIYDPPKIKCAFLGERLKARRDGVDFSITYPIVGIVICDVDLKGERLLYTKSIRGSTGQTGTTIEKLQFCIYDISTGKERVLLEKVSEQWGVQAEFLPDNKGFIFSTNSNSLFIFDFLTNRESLFYSSMEKKPITFFALAPTMDKILIGRKNAEASLVNLKKDSEIHFSDKGFPYLLPPFSWSPDGRYFLFLFSTRVDRIKVNTWIMDTEAFRARKLTDTDDIMSTFSLDGKEIAVVHLIQDPETKASDLGLQKIKEVPVNWPLKGASPRVKRAQWSGLNIQQDEGARVGWAEPVKPNINGNQ